MTPSEHTGRSAVRPPVTTLLPPARAEFLAVSDTHLVDTQAAHAAEFSSRLLQNDRIDAVLSVAAGHGGDVVHLGDLVQDYPDSALHESLLHRAVEQWRAIDAQTVYAPGNTDIGDPHDPASPAVLVTEDSVARFAAAADGPWLAADVAGIRVVLLAASVLNSGLTAEKEQWAWLEEELSGAAGRRIVLGLHYPLFLRSAQDPGVGHYDVVNEPARSRLIEIIERHGVELVLTGHSHFQFFNRIGAARVYGLPSTSFTRPGFAEMFSSAAPADRGRNDVPKLGFLLARVHDDDIRMHPVRTAALVGRSDGDRPVLSCTPRDIPHSRLGVVLRHPIAMFGDVPDTFPSVVRQPVRNDYPLLACLELGAGQVDVSDADLRDPEVAARLQLLRDEGVRVVVRLLWPAGDPPAPPSAGAPVDEVELVLLDRTVPSGDDLTALTSWPEPVVLSCLRKQARGAAELPRWRYGFTPAEALELDGALADAGRSGDRVLLSELDDDLPRAWSSFAVADRVLAAPGPDPAEVAAFVRRYLCAVDGAGALGRVWIDGLTELDRTLVTSPGLLDRACNPQPGFHAARLLTSAVHGDPAAVVEVRADGAASIRGRRYAVRVDPAGTGSASAEPGECLVDLVDGVAVDPNVDPTPGRPRMWLRGAPPAPIGSADA